MRRLFFLGGVESVAVREGLQPTRKINQLGLQRLDLPLLVINYVTQLRARALQEGDLQFKALDGVVVHDRQSITPARSNIKA